MSSPSASTYCGGGDASGPAQAAEQALLASDRYARLILAQMNKMRLRTDFCDVGLKVGGRVFRVHRLVLAASSPYFAALFAGGMREVDKEEVQILGVETEVFEVLLDFIYTGLSILLSLAPSSVCATFHSFHVTHFIPQLVPFSTANRAKGRGYTLHLHGLLTVNVHPHQV